MSSSFSSRMKDLMKKYGKVAIGVHLSVSFASIGGLYLAINNNVDVESLFHKIGLSTTTPTNPNSNPNGDPNPSGNGNSNGSVRNRTAELVASSGGALALAVLCNKALLPVRVPVTIALTPPIARFLARRNLIKT